METVTLLNKESGKLETFNTHTGELMMFDHDRYKYTVELSEAVCTLVLQGHTLTKIALMKGMPPLYILYSWKNRYPDFKKNVQEATKERADYFMDKAADTLTDHVQPGKDELALAKFKFDGYIKLAEKGNPDRFQSKPNQLNAVVTPATIVINTGIQREPDIVEMVDEEICDIGERSSDGFRRVLEAPRN